jgi:hypothetical protein
VTTRHSLGPFLAPALALVSLLGCSASGESGGANPFLAGASKTGKADTDYQNPDGVEVEVDVEGDVEAPASRRAQAPAHVAQFAMTYLRENGEFYLESLAEDVTSKDRVEWLVDGEWIAAEDASALDAAQLTHFRIRGVNAVLLEGADVERKVGATLTATVPVRPFAVMTEAGDTCATKNGHITLSSSVYWYLWNPGKAGCAVETQELQITVSRVFPQEERYPEYDRLTEDGKVTAVILYGQIGDGAIDDREIGVINMKRMVRWLGEAGLTEVPGAPVGRRFAKPINGVTFEIDLYSPNDFAGLSDHGNFGNFQRAIGEHEIVVYDGHSMLGASDFWSRPEYPGFYQVFIYGGCLGYEYYVRPLLEGKGGWENLDLVSSVIEVTASANEIAGPFFAQLLWGLEHNNNASWKDLLMSIRDSVGDSTFGASGVEENCFTPSGSRCAE